MFSILSIQNNHSYPSFWKVLFLAAAGLGIYLLLIISGNSRLRNQQGVLLGLYTAGLSLLLLNLTTEIYPLQVPGRFIQYAGLFALYIMAPVSCLIQKNQHVQAQGVRKVCHLLPAFSVTIYCLVDQSYISWLYRAGAIYTGGYLSAQVIQVCKASPGQLNWKKIFTIHQAGVYTIICVSYFTIHFSLVSSISLSFLILVVWIRLLRTAYLFYATDNS
jgi:hypothetical protein